MRKIVLDMFGADSGFAPVVEGAAQAMLCRHDFGAVAVGNTDNAKKLFDSLGVPKDRVEYIETDEFIAANASPMEAFSKDSKSSMVLALHRLRDDPDCVGMVSAGNTGALLVGSVFRLGMIGKLRQPALSVALPCRGTKLVGLVDCGANIDCTVGDLAAYATMGSQFMKSMCGIDNPRVALLSVGRESTKGNALTREAFAALSALPINFVGNAEGYDIIGEYADVYVSDGFSGNLLLKSTEAVGLCCAAEVEARIALAKTEQERRLLLDIAADMRQRFDYNSQGGATFLGTKKIVVKAHGAANSATIASCIEQVNRLADNGLTPMLEELLAE